MATWPLLFRRNRDFIGLYCASKLKKNLSAINTDWTKVAYQQIKQFDVIKKTRENRKSSSKEDSTMVRLVAAITLTLLIGQNSIAKDILFEGFYKINSADQQIGFSLVRYEFDNKTKKFYSTTLTKLKTGGSEIMESLSATSEADDFMTPVSYKYTGLIGKESKIFDVQFKKGKSTKEKTKMTVTKTVNNEKPSITIQSIDSDVFLSTFLSYRMLRSQTGIQTNSQFKYKAVAEEDAKVEEGTAKVLQEENYKGFSSFKIENTFKNNLFTSYMNDKGEPLATIVPDARLTSELVAKPADAIGTIGLPDAVAKSLFGNIPMGQKNVVAQYFKDQETKKVVPGSKQDGIPAGKGIMISPKNDKKPEAP